MEAALKQWMQLKWSLIDCTSVVCEHAPRLMCQRDAEMLSDEIKKILNLDEETESQWARTTCGRPRA